MESSLFITKPKLVSLFISFTQNNKVYKIKIEKL